MLDFLYALIIYPLVQIIEMFFILAFKTFHNYGISIIAVSVLVSVITLPLYFMAEKQAQAERAMQKKLKPKIDKIKATFSGDEQYMLIAAYYRENHYHPMYAMRSSIGLLIQIPFFIAAYSYLLHFDLLKGFSFFGIPSLGKPDSLINVWGGGGVALNILPIIMTLINIIAGAVYTKGFPLRDKIQLYGMALIFLVLLYNSPSGLVLYWTANNIFSLAKNCLQKTKHSKKIVYFFLCFCVVLLDVYLLFFHHGILSHRFFLLCAASCIFIAPFAKKIIAKLPWPKFPNLIQPAQTFLLSCVILFLLAGLIIPGSLIASSVSEFSFVEGIASPLSVLFTVTIQAAGFFLLWPICIYFLFSKRIRCGLTVFMACFFVIALIDTFVFSGNYGVLSPMFNLEKDVEHTVFITLLNIAVLAAGIAVVLFLLFAKQARMMTAKLNKNLLVPVQFIAAGALFVFGITNIVQIHREFSELKTKEDSEQAQIANRINDDVFAPVYRFSKTEKNVLFIMLDRGISGYVPYIFDEKPELKDSYSGFVYYPNCVSFGGRTMFGASPLFGGYEYAPLELQMRKDETIDSKRTESFLLLPRLFSDAGFTVTATDLPLTSAAQETIKMYPNTRYDSIVTRYTAAFLDAHPELKTASVPLQELWKKRFILFDFFKFSPLFLRSIVYDSGSWINSISVNINKSTINDYAMLDALPKITQIEDTPNGTYNSFDNDLAHDSQYLKIPEYVPSVSFTTFGGPFYDEDHYHVNVAALLLLGRWFDFLKENGIWDNTRIIVVSDHGNNLYSKFPNNIKLPNGDSVQFYNPLLLFKDFNAKSPLATNYSFMTHADAPILALKDIVNNPVNPFTGKALISNKENGVIITSSGFASIKQHGVYQFNIKNNEWLSVRDNIFDPANWKQEFIERPR
jgi:YidC/Oxa1 family membrane protein insertase